MKKKLILIISIFILNLISCSSIKQADQRAKKNELITIYPDAIFDEKENVDYLTKGTSSIKGVMFTKEKTPLGNKGILSPKIYGNNKMITLFPVTKYFESWYNLRQKKENKNTIVYMSKEAYAYRLETQTDEYGRFVFENLKPGKYFLQTFMDVTFQKNTNVQTGTGYNDFGGSIAYYENKQYLKTQNERIEKFVIISKEGEIVEVNLK